MEQVIERDSRGHLDNNTWGYVQSTCGLPHSIGQLRH